MRCSSLAAAIVLTLAASASVAQPVDVSSLKVVAGQAHALYIVRFEEPPLAVFRGGAESGSKLAGLKATSPAITGERHLDMDSAATKAYRNVLGSLREDRLAAASVAFKRPLDPLFVYDVAFNGVAIELSPSEAVALASFEGVASVQIDTLQTPQTDAGPRWIGANAVWSAPAPQGNRGEGVVIAIIDSGINRTHPSFAGTSPSDNFVHVNPKGRFFGECATNAALCNTKLIGIHDFTLCTGTHNTTGCDDREANNGADGSGHGSHVGGIAAGNTLNVSLNLPGVPTATNLRISGVAPRANLISYKACEKEETCRGSWLVAAVNQATADGVDVINYSIGGKPYSPWEDGVAQAMLNAREAGVTVVAAAGNDGPAPGTHTSSGNAPWVVGVANATHDRVIANRLLDLSGGNTPPPEGGVLLGAGATAGVGPAPLVYAGDFGSPLCATGPNVDATPPDTSTNPWPTPVFNGQIVVCDRGVYARVVKGLNVRNAGAAGMVLVNAPEEGDSIVSDAHVLPATHVSANSGLGLKQWLASGTGHTGRIEGAKVLNLPEFGDILSVSSGRGPVTPFGTMKPNVTAPGSNILSVGQTGETFALNSGTSMASPHVAGAAALLIGANPSWGPSEVETALVTTARPSVRLPDGSPAGIYDQGAGTVDLARAVRSGLSFPVDRAAFMAARQTNGRVPSNLNLPSLVDSACFESCSFQRQVKALSAGTWRVIGVLGGAAVTVTPTQFTLAANASQTLSINVTPNAGALGTLMQGELRLERMDDSTRVTRLPMGVYSSPGTAPERITITTPGESGFTDIAVNDLVALPKAHFSGTKLVTPTRTTLTVTQDTTSSNAYDGFVPADAGVKWLLLPVDEIGPASVIANVTSATAKDIDLFVGFDSNGDGVPQAAEQLCVSGSPTATERCVARVEYAEPGNRFWVLPQNWRAADDTSVVSTDQVQVEAAAISLMPSFDQLIATGPGHTRSRQPFSIRAAWNVPDLLPGQTRWGFVLAGAVPTQPAAAAAILLELTRSSTPTSSAHVLEHGVLRRMALAPGQAQDRLYIEIPTNADALTVTTNGTTPGIDLYLARADTPSSPEIAPAPPRSAAAASSTRAGSNELIQLTGAAFGPGRWYVTPVNNGTEPVEFALAAHVFHVGDSPRPKFGPYFNPARSGSGLFLIPSGNAWALAWYTYLQDGTPTWYLGVASQPLPHSIWSVPLVRQTWTGSEVGGTEVGSAHITFIDATHVTFSWNLDGESGSEPMAWVDGGGCPSLNGVPVALSGLWFAPSQPGYGYSINAYPGLESNGAYFYDDLGIARWAIGSRSPFQGGERTLTLAQQTGPCPLCAYTAPTSRDIGTLTRTFTGAEAGRIAVDLELLPPLNGSWTVDAPVARASNALQCQ